MKKPLGCKDPDTRELKSLCDEYMALCESNDYTVEEAGKYDREICEKALETIYGKDVFKWINQSLEKTGNG